MEHRYLILGGGRLAGHLKTYLSLCGINASTWMRSQSDADSALQLAAGSATHILFAVSDGAIAELFEKVRPALIHSPKLFHFSGTKKFAEIAAAHPLMTFAQTPYDLAKYRQIPFVTDRDPEYFKASFPVFSNPVYQIEDSQRALYHALCVVSGNFTNMLWKTVMTDFQNRLGLPPELLLPYMEQTFANLKKDPMNSLTGPIARKDLSTIQTNLTALAGSPLQDVYLAFLKVAGLPAPSPKQD